MRRVLVPLDGTDLAASILPDARRLAGPDGQLVLVRNVSAPASTQRPADLGSPTEEQRTALQEAQAYLDDVAERLRADGVFVQTQPIALGDAALAIDEAAQLLTVDMIALATHGRDAAGRLHHGSVAWRALLRSTVPVLLRHVERDLGESGQPDRRRILVPLDGSTRAEGALPLALQLAAEWHAPLWLIRVVADADAPTLDTGAVLDYDTSEAPEGASAYLERIARTLPRDVHLEVAGGPTVERLVSAVHELGITEVVMTTHGRTGLSRVIVGSIADALIHQLYCSIIVVPALVGMAEELGLRAQTNDRA